MYPLLDPQVAQNEHTHRLKKAEHDRLVRRLRAKQPSALARSLHLLGQGLTAAGQKLDAPEPTAAHKQPSAG